MATLADSTHYDRRTILFHWLTVLLVAAQWLGAHTIDWFPRGALRIDARSVHIVIGVGLAVVIVLRLAGRWGKGRKLPPADKGVLRWAATLVHGLLYVLLIAVVTLGLLNAWARGDNLFNLFSLPKLAVGKDVKGLIGDLHGLCANAILVVAGGHAAAALWHQYVRRDGVLARMIPALGR
jgi:cytochrome b561